MGQSRTRMLVVLVAFGALVGAPMTATPGLADITTPYCEMGQLSDQHLIGDAWLAGDAPDEVPIEVPLGCYTARAHHFDDTDRFITGPADPYAIMVYVFEGCVDTEYRILSWTQTQRHTLCAGDPETRIGGDVTGAWAHFVFHSDDGLWAFRYQYSHECPAHCAVQKTADNLLRFVSDRIDEHTP